MCNMKQSKKKPRFGRRFFFFGPFRSKGSGTDSLKQEVPKNIHTKCSKWILWRLGVMIPLSRLGCFFSLFFCTTDAPMIFGITLSEDRVALITRFVSSDGEFVPTKSGQVQRQGFPKRVSPMHQFPWKSKRRRFRLRGWEGWVWKKNSLDQIWVMSRNLEFRGCFRRSRCALRFGGLGMGLFAKDHFFWGTFQILARHPSWKSRFCRSAVGFFGVTNQSQLWAEQIGR